MGLVTSQAAGGPWGVGSTWVGGVPPVDDVDWVDLKGPVTIPPGTVVSIGDWVSASAVKLTAAAAKLIVQGELVSRGHVELAANSAEIKLECLSQIAKLTLASTSGVQTQIKASGATSTAAKLTVVGTPSYWAHITSTAGTGVPGNIDGSFQYTLNWQYLIMEGLGSALGTTAAKGLAVGRNLTCDHVLVKNCGLFEIVVAAAAAHVDVNHLDIRGSLNATYVIFISAGNNPTGVRRIRNSTFAGLVTQQVYTGVSGLDVDNVVYHSCFPVFANRDCIDQNTLHVGPSGIANHDSTGMMVVANANFLHRESLWAHYTDTLVGGNTNVGHEIKAGAATLGLARNIMRDIVVEAGGNNDGTGNRSGGDFLLPHSAWLLERVLAVNGYGNVADGLFNGAVVELRNCTLVNAHYINAGGSGGWVLAEGVTQTTLAGPGRNNIFYGNVSGVCQGGNFRRQDNFEVAHNCCFALLAGGFLLTDAGVATYLERPYSGVAMLSVTPLAGSTAVKIICAGNGLGILTGDYAKSVGTVFAVITAVAENVDGANTTTLTCGINLQGTQGATGLVVGVAVALQRGYWSDGSRYGNGVHGAGDLLNTDPEFADLGRTVAGYDLLQGGPGGTAANFGLEAIKLNGWDVSGAAAVFNAAYALAPVLAYLRAGYTPTNSALMGAGAAIDGSPDIGALPVAPGGGDYGSGITDAGDFTN